MVYSLFVLEGERERVDGLFERMVNGFYGSTIVVVAKPRGGGRGLLLVFAESELLFWFSLLMSVIIGFTVSLLSGVFWLGFLVLLPLAPFVIISVLVGRGARRNGLRVLNGAVAFRELGECFDVSLPFK